MYLVVSGFTIHIHLDDCLLIVWGVLWEAAYWLVGWMLFSRTMTVFPAEVVSGVPWVNLTWVAFLSDSVSIENI